MMMPRSRKDDNNLPILTTLFTTPFVIASVVVLMTWLVLGGYLGITAWWIWVLVGCIGIGCLTAAQMPLYRTLIDTSISPPGCLAGLGTYGVCLLLWGFLFWQAGLDGALAGVFLIPLCCFGVAGLVTSRTPRERKNLRRRKR